MTSVTRTSLRALRPMAACTRLAEQLPFLQGAEGVYRYPGTEVVAYESHMKPSITLQFNGNCAEALRFYAQSLPGTILFELSWGQSPLAGMAPPAWSRKICHSTLVVGQATVHGVDVLPGTYEPPRGFSIVLDLEDIDDGDRLFRVLSEKGQVQVPMQETFWALRYGKVVDQFGIAWELSCARPVTAS